MTVFVLRGDGGRSVPPYVNCEKWAVKKEIQWNKEKTKKKA